MMASEDGKKRIAIVSSQAGAANAFTILIPPLRKIGYIVDVFATKHSIDIFDKNNINFKKLNIDNDHLEKFDLIITSTGDPEVEFPIWKMAKEYNVKTIGFLDQWASLWERFSLKEKYDNIPDFVAVIDDYVLNKCIEYGCDSNRLIKLGHPSFDECIKHSKLEITPQKRFTYISEPYRNGHSGADFDEFNVFESLICLLEDEFKDWKCVIKLHPREEKDKYDSILKKYRDLNQRVSYTEESKWDSILNSSCIIGLESILLYEGALMRRKVISCTPSNRPVPPFVNTNSYIKSCQSLDEIKKSIDENIKVGTSFNLPNSVNLYLKFIKELL